MVPMSAHIRTKYTTSFLNTWEKPVSKYSVYTGDSEGEKQFKT